jgi:hypothetical protein
MWVPKPLVCLYVLWVGVIIWWLLTTQRLAHVAKWVSYWLLIGVRFRDWF